MKNGDLGVFIKLKENSVHIEILEEMLSQPIHSKESLEKAKVKASKRLGVNIPKNSEFIKFLEGEDKSRFLEMLTLKPVRAVSGVIPITVMVKPHPCPHGRCIYCPGGVNQGTPPAYTGREPACMRGLQHGFDPYYQVKSRINQLHDIGHLVDKVELIILGGNFTALTETYQEDFVKNCLDAINDLKSKSLEESKLLAETSQIRNSGISIETRPDLCLEAHVDKILNMGVTRVELGVQTIYDEIYRAIKRGHTLKDVEKAFQIAKDSGLAVLSHFMINLPGSSFKQDIEMFKTVFSDEKLKPDCIKIYPTLVLEGTELFKLWKNGEYTPYSDDELIELLVEAKMSLPRWVRVQRIQRDIPSQLIVAGIKKGNLREIVQRRLRMENLRCQCIRCREIGHVNIKFGVQINVENVILKVEKYAASKGEEIFLSYEDTVNDILVGLLRLRSPSEKAHRPEVRKAKTMLIRELHVYGPLVPVGIKASDKWQHRGFGSLLLNEAEKISFEEYDAMKISVLSALGVKGYYRKLGYVDDGVYMSKSLS